MSTTRRQRRTRARGYLLLEVMLGGVLAAAILGGLLIQLGAARIESTIAARENTAQQLVQQGVEVALWQPFASLASSTENPVAGVRGRYERTTTVTPSTVTLAGKAVAVKDIEIVVRFEPVEGRTVTLKAVTRRYDL